MSYFTSLLSIAAQESMFGDKQPTVPAWTLDIDPNGNFLRFEYKDWRERKNGNWLISQCPKPDQRTSGTAAFLPYDNLQYVIGFVAQDEDSTKVKERHDNYLQELQNAIASAPAGTGQADLDVLRALLHFITNRAEVAIAQGHITHQLVPPSVKDTAKASKERGFIRIINKDNSTTSLHDNGYLCGKFAAVPLRQDQCIIGGATKGIAALAHKMRYSGAELFSNNKDHLLNTRIPDKADLSLSIDAARGIPRALNFLGDNKSCVRLADTHMFAWVSIRGSSRKPDADLLELLGIAESVDDQSDDEPQEIAGAASEFNSVLVGSSDIRVDLAADLNLLLVKIHGHTYSVTGYNQIKYSKAIGHVRRFRQITQAFGPKLTVSDMTSQVIRSKRSPRFEALRSNLASAIVLGTPFPVELIIPTITAITKNLVVLTENKKQKFVPTDKLTAHQVVQAQLALMRFVTKDIVQTNSIAAAELMGRLVAVAEKQQQKVTSTKASNLFETAVRKVAANPAGAILSAMQRTAGFDSKKEAFWHAQEKRRLFAKLSSYGGPPSKLNDKELYKFCEAYYIERYNFPVPVTTSDDVSETAAVSECSSDNDSV